MTSCVVGLQDADKSRRAVFGGKGANLGELCRIEGVRVPRGFCITTQAFKQVVEQIPALPGLLERLSRVAANDRDQIAALGRELREAIETAAIPPDVAADVDQMLSRLPGHTAYAVRSSATAEDLPTASFAGQQDTYLNVVGTHAISRHISKCWASLFTDRAISYRLQNGVDHRKVQLAVVVQQMVFPQAAGILFTADPVTSNRKVSSIDAGFGLGEALVAGLVNADSYKVRDGKVIAKKVAAKKLATRALAGGGTDETEIEVERQSRPALTDEQILRLEHLGRIIEAHFGCPQDIEWCVAEDEFYIVQSRPITTLFPVPERSDGENHVYVSVGHQQMMTDPFKPLGLSMWLLSAGRPMFAAGGRLFVDLSPEMATTAGRHALLNQLVGKSDPLIKDALETLMGREDFIKLVPDENKGKQFTPPAWLDSQIESDPAIVSEAIERSRAFIEELKQTIQTQSGPELFDFIREDNHKAKQLNNIAIIVAAMNAAEWINENIEAWLGEKNVADTLAQSVANNVTSEMGLALLDVADVIRPYPAVIEALKHENFLDELTRLEGGQEARDAIQAYLDKYGMRCVGEIDVTRPRWSEKPATLVPLILSNVKNFAPGAGSRKFEQGREQALKKEQALLERLKQLPDGDRKAAEARHMIERLRMFSGYREYPKYGMISRYFVYKQALLNEADRLVEAGVIREKEDIYYLSFEELQDVVRTHEVDYPLIEQRKEDFRHYEKLTPPRVLTSEGEIVVGRYKRENLPAGAIVGLAVSSGISEGRARVLFSMEAADLEEGDILVTPFTDPSWTPLFVAIKGLVTEVGGLMTHGAVIAREYGLPAVVGVEDATTRIRDGQRIRVHGTEGYVEIL